MLVNLNPSVRVCLGLWCKSWFCLNFRPVIPSLLKVREHRLVNLKKKKKFFDFLGEQFFIWESVTYLVGCWGVVHLGGPDPRYNWCGPA